MFVGRREELESLETAYQKGSFQFAVVYGRRRVGKTSMLRVFTQRKPHVIFFTGQQTVASENLALLSREILGDSAAGAAFPSIQVALESVFEHAKTERIVLIIDEYPYLAESDPGVSSCLQTLIDRHKDKSNLFLVLCGSSMSFMEHQVLGHQSPLYGRRTMQLRIDPFVVFDVAQMLPDAPIERIIELYSVVGGMPLYLSQLDSTRSTQWNLEHALLRQDAFLYAEPQNYLLQEVRSPAIYNGVIAAIANGCVRPKEIADVTRLATPQVARLLDALIDLRIVERVTPVAKATKRQVVYRICDNLFRFWYRFVPQYTGTIEEGLGAAVAARIVKRDLSTFVGPTFEEVCRQWLIRQVVEGELDVLPKAIGSWWGTNPATRHQEEIDIVLEDADGELVVGECKWRNEPVDTDVLETLERRSALLGRPIKQYYLFSKGGFSEACQNRAAQASSARLVGLEQLL